MTKVPPYGKDHECRGMCQGGFGNECDEPCDLYHGYNEMTCRTHDVSFKFGEVCPDAG